ncbi:MAG: phosphatidylglycerol lysyltransferase domain-containing protein [Deltaproteobacteria bacterium]|jgi:hypothetical protein|nr:phosphatidylglycerol lysyltransferase domain-containing protein [Deltaproteobacteria bacterium]
MAFLPLTLGDRALFREFEKKSPLVASDANFTNMFIWRNYYRFSWERLGDSLCVIANPEGGKPFAFPPLGDSRDPRAWDHLAASLEEPNFQRVPEELAAFVGEIRPGWLVVPDRDNDDYVYLGEKLQTLSGRSMHQKKNHYNYFIQNYRHEFLPIHKDLFPELMAMEDQWLTFKADKGAELSHLKMEREAIHNILVHFDELEVAGLAVKIDGAIEAYAIGENLNADAAVVHVEKGNPEIRGIYVALCSHFCRNVFPAATYVNREQDLGLAGLRRSKESLKPHHFNRKFKITPA